MERDSEPSRRWFQNMRLDEMQRILRGRNVDAIAKETAYAEWVQSLAPWSTFFTGTFRNMEVSRGGFTYDVGYSEASAGKSFERWMKRRLPGVRGFYGVDPNPSRDGHHIHGLLELSSDVRRKELWADWWERYGTNRIEPIEAIGGCSGYCAKYPLSGSRWWNLINFTESAAPLKHDDLFVNSASALAARRGEADRMRERWGDCSRVKRGFNVVARI